MISAFSYCFYLLLILKAVQSAPATTDSVDCKLCEIDPVQYLDHYEYLNCAPVMRKDCPNCIERFNCPRNYLFKPSDSEVCEIANFTYKIDEQIDYRRNYCSFCTCIDEGKFLAEIPVETDKEKDKDDEDSARATASTKPMNVATPRVIPRARCSRFTCSRVSAATSKDQHCFKEKDGDSCCPKQICVSKKEFEKNNCEYKGVKYAYGESIPINSCRSCICDKDFDPKNASSCKNKPKCALEDRQLNDGCLPIYTDECCPTNYYCPPEEEIVKAGDREAFDEKKCYFNGKKYNVGHKLKTENSCLDCKCQIPPYFTCKVSADCD